MGVDQQGKADVAGADGNALDHARAHDVDAARRQRRNVLRVSVGDVDLALAVLCQVPRHRGPACPAAHNDDTRPPL